MHAFPWHQRFTECARETIKHLLELFGAENLRVDVVVGLGTGAGDVGVVFSVAPPPPPPQRVWRRRKIQIKEITLKCRCREERVHDWELGAISIVPRQICRIRRRYRPRRQSHAHVGECADYRPHSVQMRKRHQFAVYGQWIWALVNTRYSTGNLKKMEVLLIQKDIDYRIAIKLQNETKRNSITNKTPEL